MQYFSFLLPSLPIPYIFIEITPDDGGQGAAHPPVQELLFTCVHSNWQKSMKIACGDGIFALWPSLSHGQRGKRTDLPEQ